MERRKWDPKTKSMIVIQGLKGFIDNDECFTRPMLEGIKRIVKGLHNMKQENLYRNSVDNT